MAIRSLSDFSHLRQGVLHISLQTRKIQHTQQRGWNRLGLAPSTRREKFVTLLCSFLCICRISRASIRAKFPHCHQECCLILLLLANPAIGSSGPCSHLSLTVGFPRLLSTAISCLLPSSVQLWDLTSLFLFRSLRRSRAQALCVGLRQNKQRSLLTATHPHSQKKMPTKHKTEN